MRTHVREAVRGDKACPKNRMDKFLSKANPQLTDEPPTAGLWLGDGTGRRKFRRQKADGTFVPKTLTLGDLNSQ